MNNTTSTPTSLPKLCFTREEAAQIINVSPATLDRLVRRRRIFPIRDTRRPMFPIWELERFVRGEDKIRPDSFVLGRMDIAAPAGLKGPSNSGQN